LLPRIKDIDDDPFTVPVVCTGGKSFPPAIQFDADKRVFSIDAKSESEVGTFSFVIVLTDQHKQTPRFRAYPLHYTDSAVRYRGAVRDRDGE
jgi:hypothetical protein